MPFKNADERKQWYTRRTAQNAIEYKNWKESQPCADCGNYFPHYITELDHVPERGEKKYNISNLVHSRSFAAPTVQAELKKCDLVCANCHNTRTYTRRGVQ